MSVPLVPGSVSPPTGMRVQQCPLEFGPTPALEALPRVLGPAIRRAAAEAMTLARGAAAEDAADSDEDAAVRRDVLAFLQDRSEGATLRLMRSRLPHPREDLTRVVHRLRREGVLATEGRGSALRYRLRRRAAEPGTPARDGVRPRSPGTGGSTRAASPSGTPEPGPEGPAASLEERILAVLHEARRPLRLREIAERLSHPANSRLRAAVNRLRTRGTVTMVGARGSARYKLFRNPRRSRG